ncbi:MAG: NADH-quinone oxidoreductase subunit C [Verrucomicrobia bacterium]|nr:NADH-quinone oxidoreductase subunit C [Verrucomicrobiota bacterium]
MSLTLQQLQAHLGGLVFAPPEPAAAAAGPPTSPERSSPPESEAVPSSAATAPEPDGVRLVDYASRGVHLEVRTPASQVVAAAELLDREGFALDAVTGVDWIAQGEMEVIYDYFHPTAPWRVAVRSRIPRDHPQVPTISAVFPGANWHERETHDFFGIRFLGHPDLTPLLLPEDADFHPLKKDFAV